MMKRKMTSIWATGLLMAALGLNAEDAKPAGGAPPATPQSSKGSPEFERMKSLVGTWKGTVDMGQGPTEMVSQYRLLAGGSVLEERTFAGTPNEMITMYFDKDGQLALTHYCIMGNRPGMLLKSADEKTLKFDFDKTCGINVAKESHMHALTLRFDDANTITASCKAIIDGKEVPEKPTTLKRIKS